MKADNAGDSAGDSVTKMTLNRGANILAKLIERISLGEDVEPKRGGRVATIRLVFPDFKDYFAGHPRILVRTDIDRKH